MTVADDCGLMGGWELAAPGLELEPVQFRACASYKTILEEGGFRLPGVETVVNDLGDGLEIYSHRNREKYLIVASVAGRANLIVVRNFACLMDLLERLNPLVRSLHGSKTKEV